jgi:hypothetical protein
MPSPSNGLAGRTRPDPLDIDPAISLLIQAIMRSQDVMREDIVASQRETTAAIRGLGSEMRELRRQAPGRLAFYLAASVVIMALISMFGMLASQGVNIQNVAEAV